MVKNQPKSNSRSANIRKPAQPVKTFAHLPLNENFYRVADGLYSSYWVGKIATVLQRDGNKKTIVSQIYKSCVSVRFILNLNPMILMLELLDKIKPSFRLRNYIVRRTIIKEYPVTVLRPRQLILAVHWLKEDLQNTPHSLTASLSQNLTAKLCEFKLNAKKTNLVKKRNDYVKRVVKAQFNTRYNFK